MTSKSAEKLNTRNLPRRIFLYLTGEYLILLACCLLGFLVLFLVTDIFNELEDFLDAGVSAGKTTLYFLMRQPINLVYILPFSILLSLCFVVNNLIRHQELTAIRAAGLSIPHATLPVWVLAVCFAGLLFGLNEYAGPHFLRQAEELRVRETEDDAIRVGQSLCLAYRNREARRDWFFEVFNPDGLQKGVSVKQFNPVKEGILWEIRAREAVHKHGQWIFYQGTKWTYGQEDLLPEKEEPFDEMQMPPGLLDEKPEDVVDDLRPLREMGIADILLFLRHNPDLPATTLSRFKSTFWYRLTLPLSCLVASLYGVGLTIRPQRAGAFNGFAKALALLFAYILAVQIGLILGKQGIIPGFIAVVVPNVAFLAHGIWIAYQRR